MKILVVNNFMLDNHESPGSMSNSMQNVRIMPSVGRKDDRSLAAPDCISYAKMRGYPKVPCINTLRNMLKLRYTESNIPNINLLCICWVMCL